MLHYYSHCGNLNRLLMGPELLIISYGSPEKRLPTMYLPYVSRYVLGCSIRCLLLSLFKYCSERLTNVSFIMAKTILNCFIELPFSLLSFNKLSDSALGNLIANLLKREIQVQWMSDRPTNLIGNQYCGNLHQMYWFTNCPSRQPKVDLFCQLENENKCCGNLHQETLVPGTFIREESFFLNRINSH